MNFVSLFKAVDAVMAFTDAARRFKGAQGPPPQAPPPDAGLSPVTPAGGLGNQIEARLTNVVVAALKEAFDRDHARLELERAQLEEERRRAERALQAELSRQAADRELGRLRLIAAAALVGWLASVFVLGLRAGDASVAAKGALAMGWILLLGSLGTAFTAQGHVGVDVNGADIQSGPAATIAVWLLAAGLAITAISLLF